MHRATHRIFYQILLLNINDRFTLFSILVSHRFSKCWIWFLFHSISNHGVLFTFSSRFSSSKKICFGIFVVVMVIVTFNRLTSKLVYLLWDVHIFFHSAWKGSYKNVLIFLCPCWITVKITILIEYIFIWGWKASCDHTP
jgi:hypothetical protein